MHIQVNEDQLNAILAHRFPVEWLPAWTAVTGTKLGAAKTISDLERELEGKS